MRLHSPTDTDSGGKPPAIVLVASRGGLHFSVLDSILPLQLMPIKEVIQTEKALTGFVALAT